MPINPSAPDRSASVKALETVKWHLVPVIPETVVLLASSAAVAVSSGLSFATFWLAGGTVMLLTRRVR